MLANIQWDKAPCDPIPDATDYSGFPFWEAFMAEPGREKRSADWLRDELNIEVYWPHYIEQRSMRGRAHVPFQRSVLPGILLAPIELLDHPKRDKILDWARLRPLRSLGRLLTKVEVEIIREITAKLNYRYNRAVDRKIPEVKIGQRVRFVSDLYAAFLGEGLVIDVASQNRISIKIEPTLFGGKDVMIVPAAELEVM